MQCNVMSCHVMQCMYVIHVCMYACMHVCMYACMPVCLYACMHVCMYACMHVCMYAWMNGWMDEWMHAWHACMHACMHSCLGGWMIIHVTWFYMILHDFTWLYMSINMNPYFSNTDLLEVPAIWSFQPARSRRAASLDAAAVVPSKSCRKLKKKRRKTYVCKTWSNVQRRKKTALDSCYGCLLFYLFRG